MSYQTNTTFTKNIRFIYDHIDQKFTLPDMAKAIGIFLSSLKRLFIEATDKNPREFIRRIRIELGFYSLRDRNNTVLKIALSSGFENQSAFSRCFKNI